MKKQEVAPRPVHWLAEKRISEPFSILAEEVLAKGAKKAVLILEEKLAITAARRLHGPKKIPSNKVGEVLFTVGKPNYAMRQVIARAKKSAKARGVPVLYPIAVVKR